MNHKTLSRRDLLFQGGALAGLALFTPARLAQAIPTGPDEVLVPFLDAIPAPAPGGDRNLLNWQELDSWITPNEKFFRVSHYGKPALDEKEWKLEIIGRVRRPLKLTFADLKARERKELTYTLECSGNHGFPWFVGAIGNARWTGTPLAPLLKEAGVLKDGIEAVFFAADEGDEEIRGNKVRQQFARSLSISDATDPNLLLCYEINGKPLPVAQGFPVRLVAPGWYGIACVKWLTRIEVWPTRFMNRFMARDYVTLRKEQRGERTVWTESSVGRTLLKSVPAKVTEKEGRYRIYGAAWGPSVRRVEVRIGNSAWQPAKIDQGGDAPFAWKFWSFDWKNPGAGEYSITSRAVDGEGNIQPAADDPRLTGKRTYWESNGQVTRRVRVA